MKSSGELMFKRLAGRDGDCLIRDPLAGSGDIDLDVHLDRLRLIVAQRDLLAIKASEQIRIGRGTSGDSGLLPRKTSSANFAQGPEIINTAEPHSGLFVVRNEDLVVLLRCCDIDAGDRHQPRQEQ